MDPKQGMVLGHIGAYLFEQSKILVCRDPYIMDDAPHHNSRPKATTITILNVCPKVKEISYDCFKVGAASPISHLLHENFRAHPTQKRGLHNTHRKRFHLVLARGIQRWLMFFSYGFRRIQAGDLLCQKGWVRHGRWASHDFTS